MCKTFLFTLDSVFKIKLLFLSCLVVYFSVVLSWLPKSPPVVVGKPMPMCSMSQMKALLKETLQQN